METGMAMSKAQHLWQLQKLALSGLPEAGTELAVRNGDLLALMNPANEEIRLILYADDDGNIDIKMDMPEAKSLQDVPDISAAKVIKIFDVIFKESELLRPLHAWRWAIPAGILTFAMIEPHPTWYLGKLLLTIMDRNRVPVLGDHAALFTDAKLIATLGYWNVVQAMLSKMIPDATELSDMLFIAMSQNNTTIIDYLFDKITPSVLSLQRNPILLKLLEKSSLGTLKHVMLALDSYGIKLDILKINTYIVHSFMAMGRDSEFPVLKYLYNENPGIHAKMLENMKYIFWGAAASNRLDVIQWIHSLQLGLFSFDTMDIISLSQRLGFHGDIRLLIKVLELIVPDNALRLYQRTFTAAAYENKLDLCKYIYGIINQQLLQSHKNSALENAVSKSNISVIKYLLEIGADRREKDIITTVLGKDNISAFLALDPNILLPDDEAKTEVLQLTYEHKAVNIFTWFMKHTNLPINFVKTMKTFSPQQLNSIFIYMINNYDIGDDRFNFLIDTFISDINVAKMEILFIDVRVQDMKNKILALACKSPDKNMIQFLLQRRANPWDTAETPYGTIISLRTTDREVLRWLEFFMQHAQHPIGQNTFQSAIYRCLTNERPISALWFLDQGKFKYTINGNILFFAIQKKYNDVLQFMLKEENQFIKEDSMFDESIYIELNTLVNDVSFPDAIRLLAEAARARVISRKKRKAPSSRMQGITFY